jgi:Rod binding domain-containing protein
MSSAIPALLAPLTVAAPQEGKPKDAVEAAKQFEAMLIAQMLRSAREAGRDDGEDSTSSTMLDLADQQFAKMLSDSGGLGLGGLIAKSLK